MVKLIGEENIFPAHKILGRSLENALEAARKWVEKAGPAGGVEEDGS